jgi:hypothetical protein
MVDLSIVRLGFQLTVRETMYLFNPTSHHHLMDTNFSDAIIRKIQV